MRLSQFTMTDYIVFSICSRQKKQRRRMVKTREITKKSAKGISNPFALQGELFRRRRRESGNAFMRRRTRLYAAMFSIF